MNIMDDKIIFQKYLDRLGFLEAGKESKEGLIAKIGLAPIPIFQEDIIKEVKRQRETSLLDQESILRGIITIYALDKSFPYWEVYEGLLKDLSGEMAEYLRVKSKQSLQKEDYDWAYIYGKALYMLGDKIDDLYYLTLIIEEIYNRIWKEERETQEGQEKLKNLLNTIEGNYLEIIEKVPDHSLALERMGNIYSTKGQYIKARLYYEKGLQGGGQEEVLQGIREKILEIENHAYLEAAESYMVYNRFEEALEQLEQIKEHGFYPDKVHHKKGMAHYGLGDYEEAVRYLLKAHDYGKENVEILNDLAVAQAGMGLLEDAIKSLGKAIELDPQNRASFYNRGILFYQLDKSEEALEDFKEVYKLEADPNILELIGKLEEKGKM